ncbi:hypothetical protein VNN41_06480 [Lactococcus garvieae]|uniref:hypothetical protein n=1 Tax=Lactococcus garvieae TaxID=1363 RepID=UPI00324CC98D
MSKTKETIELEKLLFKWEGQKMGKYPCFEVTFGNRAAGPLGTERVDFVTYENSGNVFRCYEIKVTKADFMSNAKKSFIGDFNYFVMPRELYNKLTKEDNALLKKYLIYGVGIIVPSPHGNKLEYIRKPTRKTVALYDKVHMMESMMKSMSRYVKVEATDE